MIKSMLFFIFAGFGAGYFDLIDIPEAIGSTAIMVLLCFMTFVASIEMGKLGFIKDLREAGLRIATYALATVAGTLVSAWAFAPLSFYPRYDVKCRTYRYYFSRTPSDVASMTNAAGLFLGTHDFRCFARIEPGKNPVKTIDQIDIISDEDGCRLEITAQSFLWHMVRCIAGSLFQISEGEMTIRELEQYLSGICNNKVKPALPDGLILWDVHADLDWHEMAAMGLKVKRIIRQSEEMHLLGTVYSLLLTGQEP